MKILITDISSYKAIVVCSFIAKHYPSIEIFTCDTRKSTVFIRTRFSQKHFYINSPGFDASVYPEILNKICKDNKIDLLLPINSGEMDLLIARKSDFGRCLDYLGDYEIFDNLNNKLKLQKIAGNLQINIPKHYLPDDIPALPLVMKPAKSSSAKDVKYLKTGRDIEKIKKLTPDRSSFVFQQYVPGKGVGISGFCSNGKILKSHCHLRLAEFPVTGGSSVYRSSLQIDELNKIAEKLFSRLPWSGFFMMEFKLTDARELYLIEVNPRIWGSINQGLQCGTNYFEPLLGTPELPLISRNAFTCLSPLLYLSLFAYLLKGNIGPLKSFVNNVRRNVPDISILNDPLGFLSSIIRII